MIAGTTSYDSDLAALFEIAEIWSGAGTVAARVDSLSTSSTVPLSAGGSSPTVLDDGEADKLTGAAGQAWYFADETQDIITGHMKGSFLNDPIATPAPVGGNGNGNGNGHGNGNEWQWQR